MPLMVELSYVRFAAILRDFLKSPENYPEAAKTLTIKFQEQSSAKLR